MKTLPHQSLGLANDRFLIFNRLLILRACVLCSFVLYTVGFAGYPTGLWSAGVLLVLSGIFSAKTWLHYRAEKVIPNGALLLQLAWDGIAILIFVCATGRSTNPFIYYLLVFVAISAGVLRERMAWVFTIVSISAYSLLMYLDTNQHMAHMDAQFRSHLLGMWINFVGSAILICFFISRLTRALKDRERALSLAREEILKNEQLIGIGTLAASTVHSFGTPLSTIAMAIGEIDAIHNDVETRECTASIKAQIDRCKATMKKLTSLASHKKTPVQNIALETFILELEEHFALMDAKPSPSFTLEVGTENRDLPGGMLLFHAIINLIENAINAANTRVNITIGMSLDCIDILIEDDGLGIENETLENLGEAVFTSKSGLGIGFLLANSTIERLGGSVRFSNPRASDAVPLTRVFVTIPSIGGVNHDQ